MISSDTIQIGKTEFVLIEDYLPQNKKDAHSQAETITQIFNTSNPISIPLKKTPSFTSSESSPRTILVGFSPIGKPIDCLFREACKRKPYPEKFKCSIIINS